MLVNVLVTGGYGFMGSHFVRYLYRTYPNYYIINLDRLTYAGNPANLSDIKTAEEKKSTGAQRYVHIKGDICDESLVKSLFKKYNFELVFHFAAETHVDRSLTNVSDFVRTNVEGTRVLLEAIRQHPVRRMIHISTDEVYGNVPQGFSSEDMPLKPSNPYAASKAAGDMLARTYALVYNLPISIVRSGNNYGSHQYPEKLIPLVITNLIEGRPIPVHGTGEHRRSWVHVKDFCQAVVCIGHATESDIYNVAGEHKSNLDIIGLVARELGKDHTKHLVHVKDRPNADLRYAPDATKLARALQWAPAHTIEQAIGDVVAWYLENSPWWQDIKAKKEFIEQYERQSKAQWY